MVEPGEAPWEAAMREVREETGVDGEVERLVGAYWRPRKNVVVFRFACRVVAGAPAPSAGADEARFFFLDALPADLAPVVRERLEHSAGARAKAVVLAQDGSSAAEFRRGARPDEPLR